MRRILLAAVLAALAVPASASATEISGEKQAALEAHGWSVSDSLEVAPVATEYGDGRTCKRGKARVSIDNQAGNPMVRVFTVLHICKRNGRVVEHYVNHGQASPGNHWTRKTPFSYPWLTEGWYNHPTSYKGHTEVGFAFGGGSWWYLTANIRNLIVNNGAGLRFDRDTSVR